MSGDVHDSLNLSFLVRRGPFIEPTTLLVLGRREGGCVLGCGGAAASVLVTSSHWLKTLHKHPQTASRPQAAAPRQRSCGMRTPWHTTMNHKLLASMLPVTQNMLNLEF
jgi:hypothetical protein